MAKQTKYGRLRSALRRFWMIHWPARADALLKAKVKYVGDNKRRKWSYVCVRCDGEFDSKSVEVNHIKPCGQLLSPDDEQQFIYNLLFGELEVLCKPCHKTHTAKERQK